MSTDANEAERLEGPAGAGSVVGHHHRDAVRLLFILVLGSEERDPSTDGPGAARIFRGEKRAMAIDFYVRYPDYLADELLTRFERDGDRSDLEAVARILAEEEPDVRTVAMVRWRRGAFQNIEQALSILRAYDLVRPLRQVGGQRRHDFEILPAAADFIARAVQEQPSLGWYEERVALVMTLAGVRSGTSLKDDQYLHPEYRSAPHGSVIPRITPRVHARYKHLRSCS